MVTKRTKPATPTAANPETNAAKPETKPGNMRIWVGAGIGAGIGSAAIAAALLYANRDTKAGPKKG